MQFCDVQKWVKMNDILKRMKFTQIDLNINDNMNACNPVEESLLKTLYSLIREV